MRKGRMKKRNRWFYALVGVILMLFAGMIYAWSVLSIPIAEEFSQWSKAQLSLTFSIVMILFCAGGVIGGLLSSKLNQKLYIWTAALLFILGFTIAAHTQSPFILYLGFGVICGFASGITYNAVLGSITRWFPDRQGLTSGILLMGFGFSSFLIGKLFQIYTPDKIGAWRNSFQVIGIVTAVVLLVLGFFLEKPDPRTEEQMQSLCKQNKVSVKSSKHEVKTLDMVKNPSFLLFYVWTVLLAMAGLALMSQASGMAMEIADGRSGGTIATVVGLISIFNGAGRVFYGSLFDKIGRKKTMRIAAAVYFLTGMILIAAFLTKSFLLLILGFCLGGLAYGSGTPISAAFTLAYFGVKHYQLNISVVNTNLLLASFGSTLAGMIYDQTQSYLSIYFLMGILAVMAAVLSVGIDILDRRSHLS